MKKLFIFLIISAFGFTLHSGFTLQSSPRISFADLLVVAELDPEVSAEAKAEAIRQKLPVNIITPGRVMIDAKAVEDGKIVYAVITDFANIYNGAYTAFYEEIAATYSLSTAKINFGSGHVIDNTGGMYDPVYSSSSAPDAFAMIPDWTDDKVYLFNAQNGDLADANFLPTTSPQLQSPKNALLHFAGKTILVSDQLSDVVQKFDTSGTYLGVFCPVGGPFTSIVDNMRSITYRPNGNLLITVGSSANQNTVQQFDTGGVHLGTFCSTGISSPFDVLIRSNDVLVSNSAGTNKITRYDLNGAFLSNFYSGASFTFPEQITSLPNGFIIAAAFSPAGTSGVAVLDAAGNFIKILQAVTGNRGVYLLGNGHYLTTNSTGVHELDSSTGALIRTVITGANFQYITPYNPGVLLSNGNTGNTLPEEYSLSQNYPNPFNPVTNIKYQLPKSGLVKISVYDINGREVALLVNEMKSAGTYKAAFNAEGLSSGAYFYKLEAGDFTEYKKMVLIK